uniref:Phage tail sheath protein n=1 Tax=Candidatus Kentrum sp. FM TaxID=2126340 RepID=A0A450VLN0_9GAMM|nr:MAG: Protein of unknown function (DUF2586) [Candidatus Kentron sp. FM]VFJ43650.1 MAG: Protein of unknown function (DUF2586) [Candidatus Kentron sp. FM]VFK05651.1 MAG: Protein of unknown function (DUF2586) [Candidatus Kentron sp. FM]
MALGYVGVYDLNLGQGEFPEPERRLLFLGEGDINRGNVITVTTDSDLDAELGSCGLCDQVKMAQLNAGQGWIATVIPMDSADQWPDAFDLAMDENVVCEGAVITDPITANTDLTDMQAAIEIVRAATGRRFFFLPRTRAFDPDVDTWSGFTTEVNDHTDGISAYRVGPVAEIYPGFQGSLAGRLCRRDVSIADTPMRVKTGTLLGIAELPMDADGIRFNRGHAQALNDARLTVPQAYHDYQGIYVSDGQLLDSTAGDFQVIENLRVVDAAARRIRILAIRRVGDRSLNSTPASMHAAKIYFMRPLIDMSVSMEFLGQTLPGAVKPPKNEDIVIIWRDRTHVDIYIAVRPYNNPKSIEIYMALDLGQNTVTLEG